MTGVQTCALPIFAHRVPVDARVLARHRGVIEGEVPRAPKRTRRGEARDGDEGGRVDDVEHRAGRGAQDGRVTLHRRGAVKVAGGHGAAMLARPWRDGGALRYGHHVVVLPLASRTVTMDPPSGS